MGPMGGCSWIARDKTPAAAAQKLPCTAVGLPGSMGIAVRGTSAPSMMAWAMGLLLATTSENMPEEERV
jgi:hypothetical protein